MIRQVSSQLADFLGLGPTPASSDEVVVRLLTEMLEVRILPGEPNPLSPMSQVAHCHAGSCEHFQGTLPFPMKCRVRESRLISINEDEGKSTGAGVSAVYQINRAETKHSARNRRVASSNLAWEPNVCEFKHF